MHLCRACWKQINYDHSQKQCLTAKRISKQQKEDIEYNREEFVKKYTLKRKATSEITSEDSLTSENPPEKLNKNSGKEKPTEKQRIINLVFKQPRLLRRKIAPIGKWNGNTHNNTPTSPSNN